MVESDLRWFIAGDPKFIIDGAVTHEFRITVRQQFPDIADLFPFARSSQSSFHLDDGWFAFSIRDAPERDLRAIGSFDAEQIADIRRRILPFARRPYPLLRSILGEAWYSPGRFTYVGPMRDEHASWEDMSQHLQEWANDLVIPDVQRLNAARVLRAIPEPPSYDIVGIRAACWVLESEKSFRQGTAFVLEGYGLVTCQHVLAPDTVAFRAESPSQRFPVRVVAGNADIDLALLDVPAEGVALQPGSADGIREMDHVAIAGFPNYRIGDAGTFTTGLVIGFRSIAAIRRILTNAPIVAGTSGGPALAASGKVVGVAVTGADRMEEAGATEAHGLIPVDALKFLLS